MSGKITRDEFESFKKEVRELNAIADERTKRAQTRQQQQAGELAQINLDIATNKNAVKDMQPRIVDVLSKDKVISSLTAEIEDMRTERIALKTQILNLTQELNELKVEE